MFASVKGHVKMFTMVLFFFILEPCELFASVIGHVKMFTMVLVLVFFYFGAMLVIFVLFSRP